MAQSIFKIKNDYLELINSIIESDGHVTDDQEQQLAITQSEMHDKALSYRAVMERLESDNHMIDKELNRLQSIKKRNKNAHERLSRTLLSAVMTFGEFKADTVTFGTRKSMQVMISDEVIDLLPDEAITIKKTANKTAIKELLKNGEKIDGCELVENLNLKIK